MTAKLYVILGSHACRTGMLLLEHKGIEYETVRVPTVLHPLAVRLHRFPANPAPFRLVGDRPHHMLGIADRLGTVPSLELDGRRVKTNREIARFLDRVRPEPPLFPTDAQHRAAVEEAERWGDEVLQMEARRLVLAASLHRGGGLVNRGDDGRLGTLLWHSRRVRLIGARLLALFTFRASRRTERQLLAGLPRLLDRVDGWIEAGVLIGDRLYAADYMIAPSLALLCYRPDARTQIEDRPAGRLVDRLLPDPAASPLATAAA
jgi:glutathione S-transferase